MHPAVEDFLIYLQVERNLSKRTIDWYRYDLRDFFDFMGERQGIEADAIELSEINRHSIRCYLAHLRRKGLQPQTINNKLTALKSFFKFASDSEEWKCPNPVKGMPLLKETRRLPVYLTLNELNQLLASVRQTSEFPERDYAIFLIFAQCGCRFSELLSLTLKSIDLRQKTLRVVGKGRKERIIPLTNRTVEALRKYLAMRNPTVETDRLFLNDSGRPLGTGPLRRLFNQAVAQSPLSGKGITPHKLRHTCLTLLHEAGVDIRTLQEIAGHTNIRTTQIYSHVSRRTIRKEMSKHPVG